LVVVAVVEMILLLPLEIMEALVVEEVLLVVLVVLELLIKDMMVETEIL
jgi:hypothetical protein